MQATASLSGFTRARTTSLSLGVAQDVDFTMQVAAVAEEPWRWSGPRIRCSRRAGQGGDGNQSRELRNTTISGRINDLTR
jgi:hypothetical protein